MIVCSSDSLCWEKKRLHASINMPLRRTILPTADLRKLKISVFGAYTFSLYYGLLADLLRVCMIRFPHLDTLEIVSDAWRYKRVWDNVSSKETEPVLEAKRLWGVESVFSLATNNYGAGIHKWTWGVWPRTEGGTSLNFSTRYVEIGSRV
jgi:hypothetical protein